MPFVIKKATTEDAYCLAEILSKSWISAFKNIIPMEELKKNTSIERRYEMFQTMLANPKGEFYIALFDNIPCGEFMFCNSRDKDLSNHGEIVSIYLLEEYWDKGLGKEMMYFALTNMKALKYNNVFLWVFKDNKRARRFYEKHNFIADGAERVSLFSNGAIEIRYRLNLTNSKDTSVD